MFIIIITWGIMFFIFFGIGFTLQFALNKATKNTYYNFSTIIWLGIAGTGVFAQAWSLFGGVSKNAFWGILILAALALFVVKKHCKEYVKILMDDMNFKWVHLLFFSIILIVALLFTIQEPRHYDTYLYHAQNIRWIEEYGLVKGLGNFHNRFAYNSSFMSLQALFSFKWAVGQSLHTLNGFLWIFMIVYALRTMKSFRAGKLFCSDMFKGLIIFYLCNKNVLAYVSSPHTDMMTLLLVAYIVTNWVELIEDDTQGYMQYGVLCLLGVFATTAKLSAALVVILVIKPALILLRERKWKMIGLFLSCGILILLPFLARNVLLSGYLVYPYPSIDLFDVDWKMPASQVETDNHEIIAWGRLLNDVKKYEEPITKWLPVWLQKVEVVESVLMTLNIVLVPVSMVVIIAEFIKRRYDFCLLLSVCTALFIGWLFTAPLPRYGLIYLYLVPLCLGFYLYKKILFPLKLRNVWKLLFGIFFISVCIPTIDEMGKLNFKEEYLFMQADYRTFYDMKYINWENMIVWVPVEGDQGNYSEFPTIPHPKQLELIELRGEDIAGGFRRIE